MYDVRLSDKLPYKHRQISLTQNINPFNTTDLYSNIFKQYRIDPDEPAHNEPSHQDLHCLQVIFTFLKEKHPLFINGLVLKSFSDGWIGVKIINDQSHFSYLGLKGLRWLHPFGMGHFYENVVFIRFHSVT